MCRLCRICFGHYYVFLVLTGCVFLCADGGGEGVPSVGADAKGAYKPEPCQPGGVLSVGG
jgi:hypothetical protein